MRRAGRQGTCHERRRLRRTFAVFAAVLPITACGGAEPPVGPDPDEPPSYDWLLPAGFPIPRVPEDDPMTAEKVALGRHLFYDQRLSGNLTQSCASCHVQSKAFADGLRTSVGSTGTVLPRSSMTLANIAYQPVLTWANPTLTSLTEQMLIPLLADDPVELGIGGMVDEVMDRLRADDTHRVLFDEAFPDEPDPFTLANVTRAIAAFQRTLVSGDSPADRFRLGDTTALSPSARMGHNLFFSNRVGCIKCHSGNGRVFFTSNFDFKDRRIPHIQFDNTGLYNLDANGSYPEPNTGIFRFTGKPEDMGRFKVPTLRNIALTAPYMHDGSVATLDEVLDHYAAAGRTISSGPHAGVGSDNPHKSQLVTRFTLTAQERQALLDFLHALTDQTFLTAPQFSNPWPPGSPAHGQ